MRYDTLLNNISTFIIIALSIMTLYNGTHNCYADVIYDECHSYIVMLTVVLPVRNVYQVR